MSKKELAAIMTVSLVLTVWFFWLVCMLQGIML